jgi:CcmD family protein
MLRRLLVASSCAVLAIALSAMAVLAQAPAAQDGFVPITELPASQQLPAAPFLIGAYAFIWLAVMVYLWSIWRRLGKVEHEMHTLESRSQKSAR